MWYSISRSALPQTEMLITLTHTYKHGYEDIMYSCIITIIGLAGTYGLKSKVLLIQSTKQTLNFRHKDQSTLAYIFRLILFLRVLFYKIS